MLQLSRAVLVMAMALPAVAAYGQFGRGPGMESYSGYVILVGGENLDTPLITIIAEQLKPRLPDWKRLPSAQVQVEYFGHRLGQQSILALTVRIPDAAELETDRQKHEVWELARLQLEKELQRLVNRSAEQQRKVLENKLQQRHRQHAESEQRAAVLAEQVSLLEAQTAGADRDSLAKAIAEAVSNQRGLQIEAAGIHAQREAIEKRIDQLRELAAEKGDPIVAELEKMVEVRQEASEALKRNAAVGRITQVKVTEGEAQLAEAKIELLRARREAEDRVGGGALRELNNELSKLLVEAAKVGGQQKQLEQIIDELRKQVVSTAEATVKLVLLRTELEAVNQQRQRALRDLTSLQEELAKLAESPISLQPLVEGQPAGDPEPEASAPGEPAAEGAASNNSDATE